jgi:hypothetical protein
MPRKPRFAAGHRNGVDTLDGIEYVEAKKFTFSLWISLYSLRHHDMIYDSDIEECIMESLEKIAEYYEHPSGLTIKREHWPAVDKIARDMITAQFDDSVYRAAVWEDQLEKKVSWEFV